MVLVALCALLLIRGASESAAVNAVMVLIKLGVLALFVVVGAFGWNTDNFADFAPFGITGITSAARHHLLRLHRPGRGVDGR